MSNIKNPKSFAAAAKDIASDVPPAPVPATTTASTALVTPVTDTGGFTGEFDASDIIMPRLSIVQKVGDLSEQFDPGSLVLNKRLLLAEPGESLVVTVLRAKKYFMEVRPYGDEVRPRIFNTHAETLAAGFTLETDWTTGAKATAKPVLDCVVAIHGTAKLATAPEFTLTFDGTPFALALWSINSVSAYKESAKVLLSAKQMYLKRFVEQSWSLTTGKVKFGVNTVFTPAVTPLAANPAARADWLDSLV